MVRWSYKDLPEAQRHTIQEWSQDATALQGLISSGHSTIHYQGNSTHFPESIEDCVDALYATDELVTLLNNKEDLQRFLPDVKDVETQVERIVREGKPAAFFRNQEIAVATLSTILYGAAQDIVSWLNSDNPSYKYRITVDAGAPIGTGTRPNGEERVTSCATVILQRGRNFAGGYGYPFSLVTMYPDSDERTPVGDLARVGRNHSKAIVDAVNRSDVGTRMYWGIKDAIARGEIEDAYMFMRDSNHGRTTWIQTQIGGDRVAFGYNELSNYAGMLLAKDTISGKYVSLANCNTLSRPTLDVSNDARQLESQKLLSILQRARNKEEPIITADSPLFQQGEGTIIKLSSQDYENEFINNRDDSFGLDR